MIGKDKLLVKIKGHEIPFNWLAVEDIRLNRILGLYKIKLKGHAPFYFPSYGEVTWLTGDDSDMGVIINKMKRELQI